MCIREARRQAEARAPAPSWEECGRFAVQGPAGNEAVGRGERYRMHGLTRTTAAVFTIAILGLMAIMPSPMWPWITGVDLGGVLLAIAALTVISVWASRP